MLNGLQRTEIALRADHRRRNRRTHNRYARDRHQDEHEDRQRPDNTTATAATPARPTQTAPTVRDSRRQITIPIAATRHTPMLPTATTANR